MNLLKIIFVFLFVQNLNAQTEVELVFLDSCEDKILKTEYEIISLKNPNEVYSSKDSKVTLPNGQYLVTFGKIDGDFYKSTSQSLEVNDSKKITDTLILPKILFTSEHALHSKYWNYYNCEKVCDGHQSDFYPNGNLRLEGIFKNGKPSEITEFRENGVRLIKEYYKLGTVEVLKVEYFDESGKLEEYEIWKQRKNKIVKFIYDSKDKFLRRE